MEEHLKKKSGPFQVLPTSSSDSPKPDRKYNCKNYQSCLEIAAALDWDSFTCKTSADHCTGEVNENLVWKAHLAKRDDKVARKLCDLPEISCIQPSNADVVHSNEETDVMSLEYDESGSIDEKEETILMLKSEILQKLDELEQLVSEDRLSLVETAASYDNKALDKKAR